MDGKRGPDGATHAHVVEGLAVTDGDGDPLSQPLAGQPPSPVPSESVSSPPSPGIFVQ